MGFAYGYSFPETKERLARLRDDLEVIAAMLAGDKHRHATFDGQYSSVRDARNIPRSRSSDRTHVPIIVGGDGPT